MPRRSVRRRLMTIVLTTSAAAITLTCIGFGTYEFFTARMRLLEHVQTLSRVVATNSTAALAFRDEVDANSVLSALKSEPVIEVAALFDAEGELFVRYPENAPDEFFPKDVQPYPLRYDESGLTGFHDVREQQERPLGTLFIRADTAGLYSRFWSYGAIAVLVMSASLLLAYLLSRVLQRRIARPLQALTDTAQAVSERGDYGVRAPANTEGEFEVLTNAFNQMLARIDTQSSALLDNERRLKTQLARLDLLHRTTRAIGERHDLRSIFQVILRNLEDNLPIDFGCVCLYDPELQQLAIESVGAKSLARLPQMEIGPQESMAIEENGWSACVAGHLVYEPELDCVALPFPQRLSAADLRSMVAAPLIVESKVFGVLVAARERAHAFSSADCEFLRQLSEHVALASHQAQLYAALQQAYDNLRVSQQTLLQQERLRALGQMASGVAHDINNAISPIALYTESLLERETSLSARAKDYLRTIQRAITDVAQTVTRLREFYRQRDQEADLLPVDLNALVGQALTLTSARWSDMPQERGVVIDVVSELSLELPKILGTESDIRDALTNLIFNAVDAMPEGGRLSIRTLPVTLTDDTRVAELQISDNGTGMDEETRRRCVEPFFTTKGERGTGMGLSMVYGMAKRHGAQIEIDSTVGVGTTFCLRFALASAKPSAQELPSIVLTVTHQRLLVIDDDPLLREALLHILEAEGHDVTVVDGGQAGIDAFSRAYHEGQPFDIVMTDLGMPYVDGRSVAVAVKRLSPGTPVILLTGWGQRLNTEQSVPPCVDTVLSKPPKLPELRRALAERQTQVANAQPA